MGEAFRGRGERVHARTAICTRIMYFEVCHEIYGAGGMGLGYNFYRRGVKYQEWPVFGGVLEESDGF